MNDPLINRPTTPGDITIISGGGGDVVSEGLNYIFTGLSPNQILKIKNVDTAMNNRIDMVGADGVQTWQISDGS